jgi:hypothetical protein
MYYFFVDMKEQDGKTVEILKDSSLSSPINSTTNISNLASDFWVQPSFFYLLSFLLSIPPIFLSFFISGSRIYDNKHFITDVIAGYGFEL